MTKKKEVALYPHRLNFYTDFFKTYNQFINYTEEAFDVKIPCHKQSLLTVVRYFVQS